MQSPVTSGRVLLGNPECSLDNTVLQSCDEVHVPIVWKKNGYLEGFVKRNAIEKEEMVIKVINNATKEELLKKTFENWRKMSDAIPIFFSRKEQDSFDAQITLSLSDGTQMFEGEFHVNKGFRVENVVTNLEDAHAIAFDTKGTMYVSEPTYNRITKIENGKIASRKGSGLKKPIGISIISSGASEHLLVCDYINNRIVDIDLSNSDETNVYGDFQLPAQVTSYGRGYIIADLYRNQIVYTEDKQRFVDLEVDSKDDFKMLRGFALSNDIT